MRRPAEESRMRRAAAELQMRRDSGVANEETDGEESQMRKPATESRMRRATAESRMRRAAAESREESSDGATLGSMASACEQRVMQMKERGGGVADDDDDENQRRIMSVADQERIMSVADLQQITILCYRSATNHVMSLISNISRGRRGRPKIVKGFRSPLSDDDGARALSLKRRVVMLTLSFTKSMKGIAVTSINNGIADNEEDDLESDTSSDLFEIENFNNDTYPCYKPQQEENIS
ncbi:hypothetical protein Syun_002066 [Stephania yunnanensis]|uniref:Uncharacterized protein n=1 Tax=Stephania yunnanensis TaxID=152371 RepID=A0AAP0LF41_9MAGN